MDIRDEKTLVAVLEGKIGEAIEKATKRILKIFQTEYIMGYAYRKRGLGSVYKPTWQFYKAWDWTPIKKEISRIVTELWYDSSGVEYDEDTYSHGSPFSTPNDVSNIMPEILEGKRSRIYFSVEKKGDFWDLFIRAMFDKGEIKKILKEELLAVGLNLL